MRPFAIIVAMDSKYGIGKAGGLAWHLSADLKHFKAITTQVNNPAKRNAVVMGRKTWDSLPEKFRPLPGRFNIVLTRDVQFKLPDGVLKFSAIDEALVNIPSDIENIFIIGGAQVYQEAINHPMCQKLYLTHVKGDFNCDAFFPPISQQFFPTSATEEASENSISYHFADYLRYS